jgi:hypothetical protein
MRGDIMTLRTVYSSIAIVVLAAANVQATLIDQFDAGGQYFTVSGSVSGHFRSNKAYTTSTGEILGDCRDVWLRWYAGPTSTAEVAIDSPEWGGFFFTQGSRGEVVATVVWDGNTAPNSSGILDCKMNLNLNDGGANSFAIDIAGTTDDGMVLTMSVYNLDGTVCTSTAPIPIDGDFTGVLEVPYSNFNLTTGSSNAVNLAHVGAITMQLDGRGHDGSDIWIRSVSTIPEPSTLVAVAIGIVALVGIRKRFQ